MTNFLDGPAGGKTLILRRAPVLLRVVEGANGIDALDQPEDTPTPQERVTVYILAAAPGSVHIRAANRAASGFYTMATYQLFDEQPTDADARVNSRWRAWVEARRDKLRAIISTWPTL